MQATGKGDIDDLVSTYTAVSGTDGSSDMSQSHDRLRDKSMLSTMSTRTIEADSGDDEAGKIGLLDLPPEIWSRICKFAVVYNDWTFVVPLPGREDHILLHPDQRTTSVWSKDGTEWYRRGAGHALGVARPAITRVCRSIRAECLGHFYKANVFLYVFKNDNFNNLSVWLDAMGSENRSSLQRFYWYQWLPLADRALWIFQVSGSERWTIHPGRGDTNDLARASHLWYTVRHLIVQNNCTKMYDGNDDWATESVGRIRLPTDLP